MKRKRDGRFSETGSARERKLSKKRKNLKIPKVNEEEEFEYYTSTDENGQNVKKLRRKTETKEKTNVQLRGLKKNP